MHREVMTEVNGEEVEVMTMTQREKKENKKQINNMQMLI